MKINVGRSEKDFVKSLDELLKLLPTCDDEDRGGMDSFDTARGDHLCFSKATVTRIVTFGPRYPNEKKKYCEYHKKKNDKDLPHALAYRRLKKLVDKKPVSVG